MATKQDSRIRKAIAAAVCAIFGTRNSGLVAQASNVTPLRQMTRAPRRNAPILSSEKDGRLYAIAMLEALEEAGEESTGADTECESSDSKGDTLTMYIYRTAPQRTPARKWIEELYQYGTPDAIAGFYAIVSHYFGISTHSTPSLERFREMEDAGEWPPAGSVIYRDPKAAAAAIAAGKDEYEITLSAEEVAQRAEQRAERDRQWKADIDEYSQEMRERAARQAMREPVREALADAAEEKKRAPKSNGEPAADALNTATAMQFHALIDLAKLCGTTPISAFTVRETVTALSSEVREGVVMFAAAVGKHPARKEVKKAVAALEHLDSFVTELDCSENDEKTSVWQGRAIHAFTLDAARALERAQIAIGGRGQVGWLEPSQEWGME